jgi:hypothetical protein
MKPDFPLRSCVPVGVVDGRGVQSGHARSRGVGANAAGGGGGAAGGAELVAGVFNGEHTRRFTFGSACGQSFSDERRMSGVVGTASAGRGVVTFSPYQILAPRALNAGCKATSGLYF